MLRAISILLLAFAITGCAGSEGQRKKTRYTVKDIQPIVGATVEDARKGQLTCVKCGGPANDMGFCKNCTGMQDTPRAVTPTSRVRIKR